MSITKYLFYILTILLTGFGFSSFKKNDETIKPITPPKTTIKEQTNNTSQPVQDGYAAIYTNKDNELMLTKTNNETYTIVKENGQSSSVQYAHNNYEAILFTKDNVLYLLKTTDINNHKIIADNVENFFFTDDDKYIIYTTKTTDTNLYYKSLNKDPIKIDSEITKIIDYSNNYIIYTKNDSLYIQKLDYESKTIKISDNTSSAVTFSKDEKRVIYLDNDKNLYTYSIFQNKSTKITSSVKNYIIDNTGSKIYYIPEGAQQDIYYYDGSITNQIAEKITMINDTIVENEQILYSSCDESNSCTLYYIKEDSEPIRVESNITDISAGFITNNEFYYHYKEENIDKLKYVKINNKEIKKISELTTNVGLVTKINGGIIFTSILNDDKVGSLYSVKNGTMKKIDENIYTPSLKVSNDGNKYYYLKSYKENKQSGDLYVSTEETKYIIDKDVYRKFTYTSDKLIYYIKDYSLASYTGTLYKYNGESVKISENANELKNTPNYYKG